MEHRTQRGVHLMRYRQCLVAALLVIGALASTSRAVGTFTTIDVPGADGTSASGINERGQIVGAYFDPINKKGRGFLLDDGNFTSIDFPGAAATIPDRINNRGQIIGGYSDSSRGHGFLLEDGVFTTIDVPGPPNTSAQDINNRGQIVGFAGQHGFLLDGSPRRSGVF